MSNVFQKHREQSRYQEYLRRINPQKVLDYYDAKNAYEVHMDNGDTEIQHSCLIDKVDTHHTHGDQNPSARLNVDKKLYICYSYGGGDILWLIKTMEQTDDLMSIAHIIEQFLDDSVSDVADFLKELDGIFTDDTPTAVPIPKYSDRVLRNWGFIHPYMVKQRGCSEESLSRLQIGYDENDVRITFPHFFNGSLVGWQKRSVPDGLGYPATPLDQHGLCPKYKNTVGFPKSDTVYNWDLIHKRKRDTIVVVESPMSVAKAETLTDGDDLLSGCLATFGAKIGSAQMDLLKSFKRVFVYMDSDSPGFIASQKLVRKLHKYTDVMVVNPEPNKDLGDYNDVDDVFRVIDRAEPAFLTLAKWDRWRDGS